MSDPTDATVLVVDDEHDIADLYSTLLEPEFDVKTATSGAEALEKADETVDVMLLDRRMPEMSGDEVLIELRERGVDCRVAMLTAIEPEKDIVELPFDDYEVKPVDQSDLLGLVEVLLKRDQFDRQSQEFFSLASKKAALEVAGNDDTPEYNRLANRVEELHAEIDATLEHVEAKTVFSDLPDEGE
ncbi:MAG: response regulator [Halobacteriales archaeon]|nr:response regulator [Halobacteriales archaeon]